MLVLLALTAAWKKGWGCIAGAFDAHDAPALQEGLGLLMLMMLLLTWEDGLGLLILMMLTLTAAGKNGWEC